MVKLKPCPFCGGEQDGSYTLGGHEYGTIRHERHCFFAGVCWDHKQIIGKRDARAWNTRAIAGELCVTLSSDN